MARSPSPVPRAFDFQTLTGWLAELSAHEAHLPVHYDLDLAIRPDAGELEVAGVVEFRPGPGKEASDRVSFLLNPDLELATGLEARPKAEEQAHSTVGGGGPGGGALRTIPIEPGQTRLALRYRGKLPQEWVSPKATELAVYNLWHPVFSSRLPPFTFRLRLSVPPQVIPAVSGRLVPLPPELVPREHDDEGPRTYVWESMCPSLDISVCAAPFLVHQRFIGSLSAEAFVLGDDFDLGEPYLDWTARVLDVLTSWFGPLELAFAPEGGRDGSPEGAGRPTAVVKDRPTGLRLGIVIPPESHWGGYARPGHVVMPRPMAAELRDPAGAKAVALWVAHEVGHLWFGAAVPSDSTNEPWMSEAFAEFGRLVFAQAVWGETEYRERLARYRKAAASAADPRPMGTVKTGHPEMDALVRLRGGVMLAELREMIGDELMSRLLRGFVARHAGRLVLGEDFVAEANRVTGRDLRSFFASYLERPPATEERGSSPDSAGTE